MYFFLLLFCFVLFFVFVFFKALYKEIRRVGNSSVISGVALTCWKPMKLKGEFRVEMRSYKLVRIPSTNHSYFPFVEEQWQRWFTDRDLGRIFWFFFI